MSDESQPISDYKPRPPAADDFAAIRARRDELRREQEKARANQTDAPAPAALGPCQPALRRAPFAVRSTIVDRPADCAMDWRDCCILGCLA